MRVSVIGCGYLGAVHASALAKLGHEVIGIDTDSEKIELLASGHPPFFEPGLADAIAAAAETGRLRFSTRIADAAGSRVHFLAVGTPQLKDSFAADLSFVDSAVESLIPYLADGDVVVGKSTVPVGTAQRLAERIAESGSQAVLAWNPEFLREGFAVQDTISPDRLVYGVEGDDAPAAVSVLNEVYATAVAAGTPVVVTNYATAELVKSAANAFLATKISFINAMAEISEVVGADVTRLADAIGYDARIGRSFLNAGVGFGGGCLPKDIRAFRARAEELGRGQSLDFLRAVDEINLRRRQRVVDLVLHAAGSQVFDKVVAVLGLAFKPHSDDIRDSPALDVAVQLRGLGAHVVATDPQAIGNARRSHPQLDYRADPMDALRGADIVVLVTEWPEYVAIDPTRAAGLVRDRHVIDGRNCLDAAAWRAAQWSYSGLGRP